MDTNFKGRRAAAKTRSGGKILRGRRVAAKASPYGPPPNPESPNWLSRLFSPAFGAARMISKGVGDLFSPILFGHENFPSSSSSWSSSSSNSSSGNVDDENDISSDEAKELNLNGSPSKANTQLVIWNSEAKCEIEQLILKEKFTMDECFKLTKIIQSRVVDKKLRDRTVGTSSSSSSSSSSLGFPESLQTRNSPVMEARKWLEEKKLRSNSSKSGLDYEGDAGSLVDVAKSYMRVRGQ